MYGVKITISCLMILLGLGLAAQESEKVFLSGTGSDDTRTWKFFCTGGMNAGKWTNIEVPSCWELQGFGKYNYGFAKDSVVFPLSFASIFPANSSTECSDDNS